MTFRFDFVVGIKSLAGFIENEQGRRFDHRPSNQNHPLLAVGEFEKVIFCEIFEIESLKPFTSNCFLLTGSRAIETNRIEKPESTTFNALIGCR